jgi:hypothetical protein
LQLICEERGEKTGEHLGIMFYAWPGMDDGVSQIEETTSKRSIKSLGIYISSIQAKQLRVNTSSNTGFGEWVDLNEILGFCISDQECGLTNLSGDY